MVVARALPRDINLGTAVNWLLLFAAAVAMFYPLWYVLMLSLSDPKAVVGSGALLLPQQLTFSAFAHVLSDARVLRSYYNTAFIVIVGTLISVAVTTLYSYTLSHRIPGAKALAVLTYTTILFHGGIVPTYFVVRATGLLDSLWSLIIPQIVNPFYVFIMIKFFASIPSSLEESARIDGAHDIVILFQIIVPLAMPALASISLFYSVRYWNAFFEAIIYISDSTKYPLQVMLRDLLIVETDADSSTDSAAMPQETVKMATVVVVILPMLFIYPFLQKYFAKGVIIGAVKG